MAVNATNDRLTMLVIQQMQIIMFAYHVRWFVLQALWRLHILQETSVHSRQNRASILVNLMGPLTVLRKIYVNML
jgi:hypothetical protein